MSNKLIVSNTIQPYLVSICFTFSVPDHLYLSPMKNKVVISIRYKRYTRNGCIIGRIGNLILEGMISRG
ncbi:hypothetical protein Y032_0270g878 [Ancylostoma ceylanicum]|uniref:Uncharacterized protein n=1 Tax=Ancylostoma ceylanicum TaxID=53326 RepID=A0A016S9P7_9BILA|nr:hypothetical protein Y032_0270g878 [Ancylostoma ceylanicum]